MPKTKQQKQEILTQLAENIEKQNAMVFVDFKGLKVKQIGELRKQLKQAGSKLTVAKKTLLSKALKEKGIEADVKGMAGEIAAIFAFEDPIAPIKIASTFAKSSENLRIAGGYFENELQNAQTMIVIGNLPSRKELLAKFVGTIAAPVSGFMNVLQGNIKGLIYILAQKAKM